MILLWMTKPSHGSIRKKSPDRKAAGPPGNRAVLIPEDLYVQVGAR